ncbi:MAG TPA: hypothetical protein VGI54_09875 [Solirubrobacteraceae bacterium]
MGERTKEDVRIELEYFERIEVNPRLILLRLGGQPAPEDDVVLLVTADGDSHRTEPLAGSVAVEPDGRWRAAFPIRRELMETAGVTFALEAGETIDLPSPTDRVLSGEHEATRVNGSGADAVAEEAATEDAGAAEDGEESAAAEEPEPPASSPKRRSNAPLVWGTVVLGLLAAVAVVAFALGQGGSDSATTSSKQPAQTTTPQTLAALPGTGVKASAQAVPLGHDRFSLRIRGLKAGTYEAWAFNSIIDCKPLATFKGPAAKVTITLPADASRYHFLDVSREGDASPNHSGLSVLRVPMSALTS